MGEFDPQPAPGVILPPPEIIAYESADPAETRGRRPWWVLAVVGVYLLLVAGLLLVPCWLAAIDTNSGDRPLVIAVAVVVCLLTICGLALLITPVRVARRRLMTRRSILIPIIASGLLFSGLVLGAGLALWALFWDDDDAGLWTIIAAASAVWIGWSVVFCLLARRDDPASLGMKLHRWLIAGSVLELLVAVPSHIIVRRRNDCCAGFYTGTGICLGAAIALVSFGPSVLLLYYQRCKKIRIAAPLIAKPMAGERSHRENDFRL